MPPPPQAMTMNSLSSRLRMESASTIFLGSGLATTRRQPRPESSAKVISGFSAMICLACSSV